MIDENMNNELTTLLMDKGADIVRYVDISMFPKNRTFGLNSAILLCIILSKSFILSKHNDIPTEYDEYLESEHKVENLADWLECYIKSIGYKAYSQSEKRNMKSGITESSFIDPELKIGVSNLPQKTIAHLSGLGFVGKNNLLVSNDYGCAIVICSVMTDLPILTENKHPYISSKCGQCNKCVEICPTKALIGNEWK